MKNLVLSLIVSVSTCVPTFAAGTQQTNVQKSAATASAPVKKLDKAAFQRIRMRQFGGFVKDVRAQKGKVVLVNAQTAADAAWFSDVSESFDKMVKVTVEIAPGTFDLAAPKLQGTVSVFIVDDPKLPMSLVAHEAKWAMVNVSPLKASQPAFFKARVQKELTRVLAFLFGAADSQYPMCLTGCVTRPEDLDQFVQTTKLPMDVAMKLEKTAPSLGLVPYKLTTYRNAVVEGWAPAPTNDYQKAIWKEVHTLPTAPIAIKPETKRQK